MPLIQTFRYRPEVDGLRAVAVLAVVLFHTGFGCPGGFVGVDVFFVISGYLITSLIWKGLESNRFTFVDFWERRARRIIPALVAVTLATLIAGYFILLPTHLDELGRAAASQSVFAANFHYWQNTGYFAGAAEEKPLLHTWSLAVEEQFYLVVPFLLWGIARVMILRHRWALLGILGIGLILSFAASFYGVSRHPSASFYLLPTRAWELLLGSIIAFLPPLRLLRQLPILAECISLLGLLLIAVPVFTYGPQTLFPGMAALPPCIGAAMFIWSNTTIDNPVPTRIGAFLAIRPLVFIGLISYSWYLWHWPLLAFGNYLQLGHLSDNARIGLFFAGFACAVASWKYVETPFRKQRLWKARRWIFGFSGASLLFIFVAGVLYAYHDGFPNRVSAQALAAIEAESDRAHIYEVETNDIRTGNAPRIGAVEAGLEPALLVWGDSHAMAALPAIDEFLTDNGLSGCVATHSSTAPVIGWFKQERAGLNERSIEFNEAVLSYIAEQNIPAVFLNATWPSYAKAPSVRGTSFEDALVNTVKRLRSLEVNVYIMLDVPIYPFSVPKAVARLGERANSLSERPSAENRRLGISPSTITQITGLGAIIIDPKPAFLDQDRQRYRVYEDGVVLYRDARHLTASGAIKVLKPLLEKHLKSDLARQKINSRSKVEAPANQPAAAGDLKSKDKEKDEAESRRAPGS